jgi:tRNA-modifying protein YgfZ
MPHSVPESRPADHRTTMLTPARVCLLEDLGVLHIAGADARKFLQGQLSNDLGLLRGDALLRAGLHNPQGRTVALLAMLEAADGGVLALLPRELLPNVSALLKRYVLRAKVTLTDVSDDFRLYGLDSADAAAGQRARYGLGDDRRQVLLQSRAGTEESLPISMRRDEWLALDIAAGLPQIGAAISGDFVAQMLNLDCIAAVSFNKGCYTGQEIIARAHFRGRVKRRMQRFVTDAPCAPGSVLTAGASGRLADGRHYHVVEGVVREDGHCEFLAVAHLPGDTGDTHAGDAHTDGGVLATHSLPLPYPLP